jgi:hypothetical protein
MKETANDRIFNKVLCNWLQKFHISSCILNALLEMNQKVCHHCSQHAFRDSFPLLVNKCVETQKYILRSETSDTKPYSLFCHWHFFNSITSRIIWFIHPVYAETSQIQVTTSKYISKESHFPNTNTNINMTRTLHLSA